MKFTPAERFEATETWMFALAAKAAVVTPMSMVMKAPAKTSTYESPLSITGKFGFTAGAVEMPAWPISQRFRLQLMYIWRPVGR